MWGNKTITNAAKTDHNRAALVGMQFELCEPLRPAKKRKSRQARILPSAPEPADFSVENEQMARLTINQRDFTLKLQTKTFTTYFA